jgi:hypothetical protein
MGEAWQRVVASGAVDRPSPRCREAPPAGLLEGIQLFNTGQYYECHHVLEALWVTERDPIRYLYQGILQIGVGFYHLSVRRNYRGAVLLLRNGIDKVRRYQPVCMTIDTKRLCDETQACLDLLHALGRDHIDGFDWSRVPQIHLFDVSQAG